MAGEDEQGPRRPPGALEAEVLSVLWTTGEAMTAGQVRASLDTDLAYTTVLTILARLFDKGALRRCRAGRAYAYRPVSDEAGLAARRMRRVLDEEPDRDTVLARFVGDLSEDDEQLLRRLLED